MVEQGERVVQLAQLRTSLQRRAGELSKEATRLDEQVSLLERRVKLATAVHVKYKELQQSENFFSPFKVQEKEAELIDQQTRFSEAKRARISAERELEVARSELSNVDAQLKLQDSQSERAIAIVEQELTETRAKREIVVRAPQDGVVSAITAQRGQFAEGGSTLARLVPSGGELEAELFASSHSAGLLKVGLPVSLRFESFPFERFGQGQGVVREISRASLAAQEVTRFAPGAQGAAGTGPVYRVRVKLQSQSVLAYGVAHLLPPGGAIDASIVLDSRPLYQWILDPIYTLAGRS
jgi:membrane fusion protein